MSLGEKVKNSKEKKKGPGWSIEEMKERPDLVVEENTDEMNRWRSLNQSEIGLCWKRLAERMEEEVLDKYKVEESKKGAFNGRGNPLEWKRVRRSKKYRIRKWGEDCWARLFPLLREYNLQRLQSKQEELTEEEEMKQQQRMAIVKDLLKTIGSKRKHGCRKPLVGRGAACKRL